MRRHVEAIGEKRHRSGDPPGNDLDDHHAGRQRDDVAGALLVRVVRVAQKDVIVDVLASMIVMHASGSVMREDTAYAGPERHDVIGLRLHARHFHAG